MTVGASSAISTQSRPVLPHDAKPPHTLCAAYIHLRHDANGAALQQAIWLDDLPVGVLAKNSLRYVQPDHLGSPRAVIDPVRDVAIWTWDLKGEAFGNTPPDQDPDKDGTAFVFDMRFPGQRYDAATGFNQNYFRDYDAGTGRYGQSDPIGLMGGIDSYSYVRSSPLTILDMSGLSGVGVSSGGSAGAGLGNGGAYQAGSGVGIFTGNGNPNLGGFTYQGGFMGDANFQYIPPGTHQNSKYSPQDGWSSWIFGASTGLGLGVFGTNADCAEQLLGPFDTWTLNVGVVTLQVAYDAPSGIFTASAGYAKGIGFDFSRYKVETTTASTLIGGCGCGGK